MGRPIPLGVAASRVARHAHLMMLVRQHNDAALALATSDRPADKKARANHLKLAATYPALADEIIPPAYPADERPKDPPPPFQLEP